MPYKKKYLPLIIGVAIAAGIFIGGKLNFSDVPDKLFSKNSKKDKLNRLIDYIDYDYVDDINTDSIVDVTVNGILENLDPHSVYIPKEDMQSVAESMKGDFVGIGISFYPYRDSIAVIRAIEGGPSDKAGIKGGDRIVMADGDTLFGNKLKDGELIKKLKGPLNSKVNLKVFRKGQSKLLDFTVKRSHIPIKSVDAAYMLTKKLGYIKINRFAESTYKEFKKGLDKLLDLGATEIALDLRDNPGGFLGIAEQIADEFLEDDKLILFTKNKRGNVEKSFATDKGDFENGKLYVLINENSASASEIVAGALQDNDKGTIVGRRSYGKGLVQREMDLGDGSAVRLTVSRYYTPTGRSIQRPYNKGNKDYYDEYFERLDSGELLDPEKIHVADSLKYKTPKGKIVYGGGGIIPDVFVPIDNSMQNETLTFLQRRGFMGYFIFETLEKDRMFYGDISRQDFIDVFEVPTKMVYDFQEYLNKRTESKLTFVAYHDEVKQYLKATLADQLYGAGAFEEVFNQRDIMIEEVIELSEGGE
ncbi:Carboxy-terminal processing protease CtpB precursor [Mariniflexile rhizosphaerae]|uniref:S41 family peptidase n=1 Tax=unclassified Mariniflexile TaxID=2643887 RepID=UPI000CBC4F34|nr:S41 family peptidase [Mariniflexile sp. TRM1-10]AXP80932.1 Carboxy-terminal processing protease CtpB precursor [Mariniflexile sp. TRM1-10]PLB19991.1 MAG: Carboxy-terminal processing protease [Flavobacteriaceae bacterium FS1-H7996/R]